MLQLFQGDIWQVCYANESNMIYWRNVKTMNKDNFTTYNIYIRFLYVTTGVHSIRVWNEIVIKKTVNYHI